MSNISIWPINRTLSGDTTPGQRGPVSDGNKGVLRISQSSSITEALPSDCLMSYPGYWFGESYPSAEIQSVYFLAPTDWALDRTGSRSIACIVIIYLVLISLIHKNLLLLLPN